MYHYVLMKIGMSVCAFSLMIVLNLRLPEKQQFPVSTAGAALIPVALSILFLGDQVEANARKSISADLKLSKKKVAALKAIINKLK